MNYEKLVEIKNTYIAKIKEKPSSNGQIFIATRNVGRINPESIEEYIATDGYFALNDCLNNMSPEEVISVILKSGLRGRGGAGFPTGKKWQMAHDNQSNKKFIICNGDEGDPGAFMDRAIIEEDPHSIVEAMTIGGYAIGANYGVVYIRAEYPLACERIEKAIRDAKNNGLLGENILGSNFSFDIIVKKGAGAFVCGEETALIKSCEGKRGEPSKKPPYPAQKGFMDYPSIINNIETLANIPTIIRNGAEWFNKIGTENSKGTKVFALTGKIKNTGLFELPMGTTINEILNGVGGGALEGKKFKAVQMGGPSGGCIPEEYFNTPVDYESLKSLGAMMGSGGIVVMDNDTCMVDIAKFFLTFSVDESCGKCTPCRIGNKRLLEILEDICSGKGKLQDLETLEDLSKYVISNSLCGLGQSSPNPVLSTLKYFKNEYLEHIEDKHCSAEVCKKLKKYVISKDKCVGCSMCARVCPVNAISGEIRQTYHIDQEICIKCGKCKDTCRFNAIERK